MWLVMLESANDRIIYFPHLLSTNHKCTQPCYFPLAMQTYCSEAKEGFGVHQKGVLGE
jgi:hypothetical protein